VTVGSAFDFSNLGCTHHCYNDFALMKTLPGTEILYPGSPIEFDTLFRKAYADDSLTLYRIPANSHKVEFSPSDMEIGKGNKIKDGGNVSIIAIGPHLNTALETAELLSHRDIEAEIIYINSIRPLDTELLGDSIAKTKRVVVIEDHMQTGGLGDDILREFHGKLEFVFLSAAIPDEFIRVYGDYKQLCEHVGLTATVITNRISESCANV
jgi:transketolase